jgi:hypothetical protein
VLPVGFFDWNHLIQATRNLERFSMTWYSFESQDREENKVMFSSIASLSQLRRLALTPSGYSWDCTLDLIPTYALAKIAEGCPLLEHLCVHNALRLNDTVMWKAFVTAGTLKTLKIEMFSCERTLLQNFEESPELGNFWSDGMVSIPSLRSIEITVGGSGEIIPHLINQATMNSLAMWSSRVGNTLLFNIPNTLFTMSSSEMTITTSASTMFSKARKAVKGAKIDVRGRVSLTGMGTKYATVRL